MFSTTAVNHKTNRHIEIGLIALLNNETSTFYEMLSKTNGTTIHVKNIQILMIELSHGDILYLHGSTNISTVFRLPQWNTFLQKASLSI